MMDLNNKHNRFPPQSTCFLKRVIFAIFGVVDIIILWNCSDDDGVMQSSRCLQNAPQNMVVSLEFPSRPRNSNSYVFRNYQQRLSYDLLSSLASSLLDNTVFEIVRGLREVQEMEERCLFNQRVRSVNEAKGEWELPCTISRIIMYGPVGSKLIGHLFNTFNCHI
jgi:hypothetical protein